jgi:hypothetical protein
MIEKPAEPQPPDVGPFDFVETAIAALVCAAGIVRPIGGSTDLNG